MNFLSASFFCESWAAFFFASAIDRLIKINWALLTFYISLPLLIIFLRLPGFHRWMHSLTSKATLATFRNWRRCRAFSQNFLRRFSFFHCKLMVWVSNFTMPLSWCLRILLRCFCNVILLLLSNWSERRALFRFFCLRCFLAASKKVVKVDFFDFWLTYFSVFRLWHLKKTLIGVCNYQSAALTDIESWPTLLIIPATHWRSHTYRLRHGLFINERIVSKSWFHEIFPGFW